MAITWSKQWGLRFYRDGLLLAEATKPVRRPFTFSNKWTKFWIGRDLTRSPIVWENHFQISDLRFWESAVPRRKVEELYNNAGMYMCCLTIRGRFMTSNTQRQFTHIYVFRRVDICITAFRMLNSKLERSLVDVEQINSRFDLAEPFVQHNLTMTN